jgi:hypothetical protein
MTVSVPLYDLLTEILAEVNKGLQEAIEASADQPSIFVAPQIDIQLRCTVIWTGASEIAPSNATASNYYNAPGDSTLTIQFKLKPR